MKIKDVVASYLKHLKTLGRSPYTIRGARYGLRDFARFLQAEDLHHLEDLTGDVLEDYQQELAFRLTAKGKPLSSRSQAQQLSVVKGFSRFLKEKDYLVHDPAESVKLPRKPKRLPRTILSTTEVKKLLKAPDTRTNRGYRNRIILEILYDTGIRRAEIASIKTTDLDLEAGYVHIRGKGDKDRVVPLSSRVCQLVRNYLLAVRPFFIRGEDKAYLILNRWGRKMDPNGVWAVVKRCALLSGIKKNVTTHTLRHSCATHMLKAGAPIRHLQEMLGHESLESTEIYTHVTINDLKEIHARYHPGEHLEDKPKQ
jgi:integrase/recombinase XerD